MDIPVSENPDLTSDSRRPSTSTFRSRIEGIFLRFVRGYTFHTPIKRGKYHLHTTAMRLCRHLPNGTVVPTKDGRRLCANLATGMQTMVYFHGEYETVLTEMVRSLLRPGDICLDVGANFGWYTTLFHKHCGPDGAVHAFEPVPAIFRELQENYRLMDEPKNVFLNNLALGDNEQEITINLFANLPTGHASLSDHGRTDSTPFPCQMITLDSYLAEREIGNVDLVKVDVEGAELMFLKGAESLFEQPRPAILMMEMALQQTRNFGYGPNDLLKFINERAPYDFFAVNEYTGTMRKILEFADGDIGANVFCIPKGHFEDRTAHFLSGGR